MKWVVLAGVVVVSCALVTSATAHHSFAATYLENESVTIGGQLVQLQFRNPHSFAQMVVREPDGHEVRYAVEWRGAGELGAQGVTPRTLQVGDYLLVTGNPSRQPKDHRVRLTRLVRPRDGFNWAWK